jgi:hypothetical protein
VTVAVVVREWVRDEYVTKWVEDTRLKKMARRIEVKPNVALFASIFMPEDLGIFDYCDGFPDDVGTVGVDMRYRFSSTEFHTYRNLSYKPIKPARE